MLVEYVAFLTTQLCTPGSWQLNVAVRSFTLTRKGTYIHP